MNTKKKSVTCGTEVVLRVKSAGLAVRVGIRAGGLHTYNHSRVITAIA